MLIQEAEVRRTKNQKKKKLIIIAHLHCRTQAIK